MQVLPGTGPSSVVFPAISRELGGKWKSWDMTWRPYSMPALHGCAVVLAPAVCGVHTRFACSLSRELLPSCDGYLLPPVIWAAQVLALHRGLLASSGILFKCRFLWASHLKDPLLPVCAPVFLSLCHVCICMWSWCMHAHFFMLSFPYSTRKVPCEQRFSLSDFAVT